MNPRPDDEAGTSGDGMMRLSRAAAGIRIVWPPAQLAAPARWLGLIGRCAFAACDPGEPAKPWSGRSWQTGLWRKPTFLC